MGVVLHPTFASEASCNQECPQLGVLFVYLHKGEHIAHQNPVESVDPFVNVYLNDQPVFKSKVVSSENPVFDERFQIVLRSHDPKYPELLNQTLRFDVEDYDKFTENDFLARAILNLSTDPVVGETLSLRKGKSTVGHGTLTVSVVFKPVPFFE